MGQPRYEPLGVIRVIGGIIIGVSITEMLSAPLAQTILSAQQAVFVKIAGCLGIAVTLVFAEAVFLGSTHVYNIGAQDDPTRSRKRDVIVRGTIALGTTLLSCLMVYRLRNADAVLTLMLGYAFILYDLVDRRSGLKPRTANAKLLCNDKGDLCLTIQHAVADIESIRPNADRTGFTLVYLDGRILPMASPFTPPNWEAVQSRDTILIVHLDDHGHFTHEYLARIDRSGPAMPTESPKAAAPDEGKMPA